MMTTLLIAINLTVPKYRNKYLLISLITLLFTYSAQAQLAAPNEAGVTLGHIHLNVSDIEFHAKLWSELFDGELVKKGELTAVRIPGVLIFFKQGDPTAPSQETVVDYIGLKVRDLNAILSEWQTLGYEIERNVVGANNPHAYLTMPNGTKIELEEDTELSVKAATNHIHFATPQYRKLMTWYADLFGALPQHSGEIETTASIPGATLNFNKAETDRKPTENTAIDHIGFEVEDIEKFVEKLQAKGVKIELGPRYLENINLWIVFFVDPSGVLIEVTEGLDQY